MRIRRVWVVVTACVLLVALLAMRVFGVETFQAPRDDTIFVSVASYRDSDCIETVRNLFEMADKPERVWVGICEQNETGKEGCVPGEFKYWHRVRRITIPHKEAKGPTYARYLCSTLYRGETYFMQIDSHTRFIKKWDSACIRELKKCPSEKAVLSHYPHDWSVHEEGGGSKTKEVPVLCKSKFDSNGVLTFEAASIEAGAKPKPVPFTSGGFVFGPGTMLTEVPYDPDLPFVFQGEEIAYSARLWTSGYDFFTPTENIVFHQYGRETAPKFWNDMPEYDAIMQKSLKKVRGMLDGSVAPAKHGLGTARSLQEYWKFAGVDIQAKKSASEKKFCK